MFLYHLPARRLSSSNRRCTLNSRCDHTPRRRNTALAQIACFRLIHNSESIYSSWRRMFRIEIASRRVILITPLPLASIQRLEISSIFRRQRSVYVTGIGFQRQQSGARWVSQLMRYFHLLILPTDSEIICYSCLYRNRQLARSCEASKQQLDRQQCR